MSEVKPHAPIKRLGLDLFDKGRVFVVGDVHGCLDLLMRGLDQINFNTSRDTLLSVGDLIDRGPRSFDALRLLSVIGVMEPPVIVNIEPVMIEFMEPFCDRNYRASW